MSKLLLLMVLLISFGGQLISRAPVDYQVHEKPLTNISIPLASEQVISPRVFEQLGSQERAIADSEKRFSSIDQRISDTNSSVEKLRAEVKPLEDTNVQVQLVLKIGGWVLGIILGSGIITAGLHFLRDRFFTPRKAQEIGIPNQPGVLSNVLAAESAPRKEREIS